MGGGDFGLHHLFAANLLPVQGLAPGPAPDGLLGFKGGRGFGSLAKHGLWFSVSLEPYNLFSCFLGVFIGTLIGVLPGLGPVGHDVDPPPGQFQNDRHLAIIMMAGIFFGAMYGGSTTSILVNIPGEAASVVTCLDGYQMAREGPRRPGLRNFAFGSFIAGQYRRFGAHGFAPPLAAMALKFVRRRYSGS